MNLTVSSQATYLAFFVWAVHPVIWNLKKHHQAILGIRFLRGRSLFCPLRHLSRTTAVVLYMSTLSLCLRLKLTHLRLVAWLPGTTHPPVGYITLVTIGWGCITLVVFANVRRGWIPLMILGYVTWREISCIAYKGRLHPFFQSFHFRRSWLDVGSTPEWVFQPDSRTPCCLFGSCWKDWRWHYVPTTHVGNLLIIIQCW